MFVRNHLLGNEAERAGLLDLYAQVWWRQRVRDDDTNPLLAQLRLSGITHVLQGRLQVRNRIYARVFDRVWIQQNMPDAELRRRRAAVRRAVLRISTVAAAIVAVLAGLLLYALRQAHIATEQTQYAQDQARIAIEQTRRAERHLQQALEAANTMVLELAQGLRPVMGTQSPVLKRILQSAEGVFTRLMEDAGDNPSALQSKAHMLLVYSDIAQQMGNTDEALFRAQEANTIAQRLAQRDDANTQWQRDLSISHDRLGDVRRAQGDLAGALAAYEADLTIVQRLVQRDETNTQWQYDLAVSHERVASVLRATDRLDEARDVLHTALRLYEVAAQRAPTHTSLARAPLVVQLQLTELHRQQQDFAEALRGYPTALSYAEQLVQRNPTNTQWRQDLATTLNSYAWTLLTAGVSDLRDSAAALPLAQRAVQLAAQMSLTDRIDMLDTLAVAYHLTGDQNRAIATVEEAQALLPASATDTEAMQMRQVLKERLAAFRAAQQPSQEQPGK